MKKTIMVWLLFLSLLSLTMSGCFLQQYPKKETIIHYVQDHKEELKQLCDEGAFLVQFEKEDQAYLKERLGTSTIVKGVCDFTDGQKEKVVFRCGGEGFVGGSTSVGFYYSADDQPYGLEFDYRGLSEISTGCFEWKNEDGSERIYTERICENWFYFIMDWY